MRTTAANRALIVLRAIVVMGAAMLLVACGGNGTPEQIADALQEWQEAGVDGFNLVYSVTPGTFVDFIDGVVPVLQARGLMQREYAPGPLRQKFFGYPMLPALHPAAMYVRH